MKILRTLGDHNFVAFRSGKKKSGIKNSPETEITDLEKIKNYEIDGALITNPSYLHIETAIEIAKHGLPMLIEKPLGKNLESADELLKITEEKDIPVLIGQNLLYHPALIAIKKIINDGVIGRVISARAQFGAYFPDFYKDEDFKKYYVANSSMGGGVVLTSIHEQNYLTDLFGEVTETKAMETGGDVLGIDADEGVEILLKHKSGIVSNIHLNLYQKPYYRNCQITGTEGTLYWDFRIPEIKITGKENAETIKLGETFTELLDISYADQMKHFIEVIERKSEPRMPLKKGIEDMKTALKILKEIGRNYN